MPFICQVPDKSIQGKLVDDGNGGYVGECVSLVKHQCPQLRGRSTSTWTAGEFVKSATNIATLTAIATFNASGKYSGHAAIFVSRNAQGIEVWDQWADRPAIAASTTQKARPARPGKGVGKRVIRFDSSKSIVDDGNQYRIIQ